MAILQAIQIKLKDSRNRRGKKTFTRQITVLTFAQWGLHVNILYSFTFMDELFYAFFIYIKAPR